MTPRLLTSDEAREYCGGVDPHKVCTCGRPGTTISLEGCGSTIELYPHFKRLALALTPAFTARLQYAQPRPHIIPRGVRLIHAQSREDDIRC